jgi:hypothetical protein
MYARPPARPPKPPLPFKKSWLIAVMNETPRAV